VRLVLLDGRQELGQSGRTDQLEVLVRADEARNPFQQQRAVLGNDDADRLHWSADRSRNASPLPVRPV
jgi:hypothetical protein